MPARKKTLSIKQAAELLGVSTKTLRRWDASGKLTSSKTKGGHRRYTLSNIKKLSEGKIPSSDYSPAKHIRIPENAPVKVEKIYIDRSFAQEVPNLYENLPRSRKRVIKGYVFLASFSIFVFSLFKFVIPKTISKYNLDLHKVPVLGALINSKPKNIQSGGSSAVLAAITSLNDLVFKVGVPSVFGNTLEVQGTSTLADVGVDSISIGGDPVTASAVEINYLDGLALTQGGIVYSTDAGLAVTAAGTADQVLTSAGTGTPVWKSASDLSAGKIDDIDSGSFLRSDTSDSYTSGTLTFSDGTLLDLSAIAHDDTAAQGLKLPQGASLSNPSSGEGYLAYDTSSNQVQFYNGTSWTGLGITGTGADGQVAFWTGGSSLSTDSSFLWDSTTDILSIGSGGAINPTVNLGADLGTSSLRWNNIYVGNINSNQSLTLAGQGLFTYDPADTTFLEASVLINPSTPPANSWLLGTGQGGYQRAGIDAEGDLTLGYNSAVSAPNNANPLSIYNHSSAEILNVDTSGNVAIEGAISDITNTALTVNDDLVVSGGEVLFSPIASATTSSEGNVYYDSDVDHLMLYTGSASWHRVALDMTQYSTSSASLADGSYIEATHNQATNDVQAVGWVYDGTKYVEITDAAGVHNIYDTSLVAWWKMEEASGTLDNAEGTAANDLISKGTPTYQQSGKVNYSITFDGSTDYFCSSADLSTCADVAAFDVGTASFSIGGWFKHNTIATSSDFAMAKFSGLGYKLYMNSTGNWVFGIDDDAVSFPEDSATSGNTFDDNLWHQVTAVKDGTSSIKLYVDGKEVDEDVAISATGTLSTASAFYLGIDGDGTTGAWAGSIDEPFMYTRALSPGEIEELYQANSQFYIEQTNNNNVRLYNYSGTTQNVRLDVITHGADLAEWYTVDDTTIESGDLVSATGKKDRYGVPILTKATLDNSSSLVGAISTNAGQELGIKLDSRRLLALSGRIPVKISSSSADISPGDYIGVSNEPGKATKIFSGNSMGRALESWSKSSGKNTVTVLVGNTFSQPGYYMANSDLSLNIASGSGNIAETENATSSSVINETQETKDTLGFSYNATDSNGNTTENTNAAYNNAVIATLRSSSIQTKDLEVDGINVKDALNQIQNIDFSSIEDRLSNLEAEITLLKVNNLINQDGNQTGNSFDSLSVLGASYLGDTTVTGTLNIGTISVNPTDSSINSIGNLNIQKMELGGVVFQNEKVEIDTDGNISIKEGVLKAGENVRGSEKLDSGQTRIVVQKDWEETPSSIVLTPSFETRVWISDKSKDGFTINVSSPSNSDQYVDWFAIW